MAARDRKHEVSRWALSRRRVGAWGAVALLAALLLGCAEINVAERLAYHPTREPYETPEGCVDVFFETVDRLTLHGCFLRAEPSDARVPSPAVLFAHGNAGNLRNHDVFVRFLHERGLHVLVFDYRGYGRSAEAPITRQAITRDTQAAYDHLRSRPEVDADRIGIYGMSMGGQPALQVAAANPEIRSVATLATFSSWEGIANDFLPLLGPALIEDGSDAVVAAAKLGSRPYWIGHGDADEIVDARHAPILAGAARRAGVPVELHIYRRGSHVDLLRTHPDSARSLGAFFVRTLEAAL